MLRFFQLPLDEVEEKLNKEKEKARDIRQKILDQESCANEINEDYQTRCIPALKSIFQKILTDELNGVNNVATNGTHYNGEESSEDRVKKIRDLIKDGQFDTLAPYIIELDRVNIEQRNALPINDQVFYFVVLVRSYLFDNNNVSSQRVFRQFIYYCLSVRKYVIVIIGLIYSRLSLSRRT